MCCLPNSFCLLIMLTIFMIWYFRVVIDINLAFFILFCLGHDEVAKLLLSRGANVDMAYFHGTPLHIAAVHGKADFMKVLLEHHADVISKFHVFCAISINTMHTHLLSCTALSLCFYCIVDIHLCVPSYCQSKIIYDLASCNWRFTGSWWCLPCILCPFL